MNLVERRGLSTGESILFSGKIPTSICLVSSSSSFGGGCKIPRSICLISSSSVLGSGGELLTRMVSTTKTGGGGVGSTIGWLG